MRNMTDQTTTDLRGCCESLPAEPHMDDCEFASDAYAENPVYEAPCAHCGSPLATNEHGDAVCVKPGCFLADHNLPPFPPKG